jgi:nitroreductase/dihydropteridine reductase
VNLAQLAESGHFTKVFDPSRTIPEAEFDLLVKFLYSIPQSCNVQSSHFIIAANQQTRARIAGALGEGFGINTPKLLNASHVIVFATRQNLSDEYLDELHAQEVADDKFPNEALENQWKAVVRGWVNLHRYDAKDLNHWMEKQTYLGLGMMLMAADEMGINAIPLEGFDSRSLDAELGLRERGFTASVLLALGYRAESDFYLKTPKSRLPMERHFTFL